MSQKADMDVAWNEWIWPGTNELAWNEWIWPGTNGFGLERMDLAGLEQLAAEGERWSRLGAWHPS